MRILLRLAVGATIVADTVALVMYGTLAQLKGPTMQDGLIIAGAIAFAVILILGVAAIESRGRPRPKRATAKTAAPRPTLQRIAPPQLRPIRPTVIGASEVPAAAQPIPKAPAPAPLVAAPELAPRVAPTPVRPAPGLATRLAPAPAMTTKIVPAAAIASEVLQEPARPAHTAPEAAIAPATSTPPLIAPEVIAAPAITAELEWILPADVDGQVEPQPFFELPRMVIERVAESVHVSAIAAPDVAAIVPQKTAGDDDLARWRDHAVSLVVSEPAPVQTIVRATVMPPTIAAEPIAAGTSAAGTSAAETVAPEARAPEMDAILRALDALRASADPEPPRLVVIPGGRTLRAS